MAAASTAAAATSTAAPDPCLIEQKFGSCLIVGKTASGKTTLIKSILKKNGNTGPGGVYTINVKTTEYSGVQAIEYEQLNSVPKYSIIIIEDVISLTVFQSKALREAINFNAHHKRQKIYVITHHFYKTNVYQLIPYFNYIIFTGSASNLPLLRVVLGYFKLEKHQVDTWCNFFLAKTQSFLYYVYAAEHQAFYRADGLAALLSKNKLKNADGSSGGGSSGDNELVSKEDLMLRFESFVKDHQFSQKASTIFSILISALPSLVNVNAVDLTLRCVMPSQKKELHLSLVDYVMSLLKASSSVNKYNLFLHKYFAKHCKIPKMFILNKKYFA